jgi:Spy/CpxP family protein refolding chaperone
MVDHEMLNKLPVMLAAIMLLLFPQICRAKQIPPGRWWHLPYFADQLNITDQQKDQLDKLFDYNRNRLSALKKQVELERNELLKAIDQEHLNETVATIKMKKLESTRTLLAATRFSYSLEVRKLLGYERFERLKTLYANWHALQQYPPAAGMGDVGLGRRPQSQGE